MKMNKRLVCIGLWLCAAAAGADIVPTWESLAAEVQQERQDARTTRAAKRSKYLKDTKIYFLIITKDSLTGNSTNCPRPLTICWQI